MEGEGGEGKGGGKGRKLRWGERLGGGGFRRGGLGASGVEDTGTNYP